MFGFDKYLYILGRKNSPTERASRQPTFEFTHRPIIYSTSS